MGRIHRYRTALSRRHRSGGFGIHSPFAFNFVLNVLRERLPYYAYDELLSQRSLVAASVKKYKRHPAVIGSKKISGTYKLDEANGKLTLSTAYGLGNITCNVSRNGNTTLNLLFPADKLLQMAQLVGTLTGGTSLSALSSLLGNYNGMQVGLQLYKQKN